MHGIDSYRDNSASGLGRRIAWVTMLAVGFAAAGAIFLSALLPVPGAGAQGNAAETDVRQISLLGVSKTGIAVSWYSVKGASSYELEYRKDGESGSWTRVTKFDFDELPSPTFNRRPIGIATGLECDTVYDFRVKAGHGWTELSDVSTGSCGESDRPTNLRVSIEPDCATLTWTAATNPSSRDYTLQRISWPESGPGTIFTLHTGTTGAEGRYRDCSDSYSEYYQHSYDLYPGSTTEENAVVVSSEIRRVRSQVPARDPHRVRMTSNTRNSRTIQWNAPTSRHLAVERGLRRESIPVADPWLTGYQVERRELQRLLNGRDRTIRYDGSSGGRWQTRMLPRYADDGNFLGYKPGAGEIGDRTFTIDDVNYTGRSLGYTYSTETFELVMESALPANLSFRLFPVYEGQASGPLSLSKAQATYTLTDDGYHSYTWRLPQQVANFVPGSGSHDWATFENLWRNDEGNIKRITIRLEVGSGRDPTGLGPATPDHWEILRHGHDGDTSTSHTDSETTNLRFIYRVRTSNSYPGGQGLSTGNDSETWTWRFMRGPGGL